MQYILRDADAAVDDAFARIQRHVAAAHLLTVDHLAVFVADKKVRVDRFGSGFQIIADHQDRVGRELLRIVGSNHLRGRNGDAFGILRKQLRFLVFKITACKDDQRSAQYRKGDEDHQKDNGEILREQTAALLMV